MDKKNKRKLNALGLYLQKRSINKAEVCRKIGISTTRMTWLCYEPIMYLRASELILIAKAIKVDPAEMLYELVGHLELIDTNSDLSGQEKSNIEIADIIKVKPNIFAEFELTKQDIFRIGIILSFSKDGKTDDEILIHLAMNRKSSNFIKTLKASVAGQWLELNQSRINGKLVNTYTTTEEGKKVLRLEKDSDSKTEEN